MRSDDALLLDMLIAARKIMRFMRGVDEASFHANEMLQSAVIRELQVIGEAARLLSEEAKTTHSEIPWHTISGMRNRLIHAYFDVRLDVVWQTVNDDILPLVTLLESVVPPNTEAGG
ncbi:MAG: DUF86 domain-containing protein [Anaerolineae bacterium]|nr:DUF86 domain-containing protein [Anaerolineae bacterium]